MARAREPVEVVLLTQDDCSLCDQAKGSLERLSIDFPLSVSMRDLGSAQGQALAERAGILFAPGVLVDDEPFSYGRLSERKLRRELRRRLGVS